MSTLKSPKPGPLSQALAFLSEVKSESKHIPWPTKNTLIQLTIVVVLVSLVVGAFLGSLDYIFTKAAGLLSAF